MDCSGSLADDEDLHVMQKERFSGLPVIWTLAHILHVASAV